jgi:hypothetical protein
MNRIADFLRGLWQFDLACLHPRDDPARPDSTAIG